MIHQKHQISRNDIDTVAVKTTKFLDENLLIQDTKKSDLEIQSFFSLSSSKEHTHQSLILPRTTPSCPIVTTFQHGGLNKDSFKHSIHQETLASHRPYQIIHASTYSHTIKPTHQKMTSNLSRHYTRILKQWPKDLLRPTSAFSSLIEKRAAAITASPPAGSSSNAIAQHQEGEGEGEGETSEMKRVNALYSLLDDRYAKKVIYFTCSPSLLLLLLKLHSVCILMPYC